MFRNRRFSPVSVPTLGAVSLPQYDPPPGSEAELEEFGELQVALGERFERFRGDSKQEYTAVVVPSQSFDPKELAKIDGVAHYEERLLYHLMLLRYPRQRVVYVTSKPVDPLVVEYFLHQMRGVPPSHARARLTLLHCDDASPRPLSLKILERPRLLERIAAAIPDTRMAHMSVFNSTALERTLSVQLRIPLNACDPQLVSLGSKSGARGIFRELGLDVLAGRERIRDVTDLAEAVADTWEECPTARRIVCKLDDSFSGEGNGVLDLGPLADVAPGRASVHERRVAVAAALPGLRLEAAGLTWEAYAAQFDAMGGICEVWAQGENLTSPSAQLRINPLHEVQPISTHDQVLGGPSGQIFQGATFPAREEYRIAIQDAGVQVAQALADRGVIGRLGVDFVVAPAADGRAARIHPLEINLRGGGTTHPFNTLKFLTDGFYEEDTGTFRTAQGRERCYYATDTLADPRYRGLLPHDLMNEMVLEGLHFRSNEIGVMYHLLGCLSEFGKLGCTAIGRNPYEAQRLYQEAVRLLDRLSERGA